MAESPERWGVGGKENRIVGADLASAATLTPTHKVHFITGTAEIATIALPWPDFAGELILIPAGAFTWATTGNIAVAGTAVAGRPVHLTYHPGKLKWYTHAIA